MGDAFSTVGVVFDKAVLKDGQQIPLNVWVQAIALSQSAATAPSANSESGMAPMGNPGSSGSTPGRMGGGAPMGQPTQSPLATTPTDTVGNVDTNNAEGGKGAVGGLNSSGVLTANNRGLFGLPGIGLSTATEGAQPAAVITLGGQACSLRQRHATFVGDPKNTDAKVLAAPRVHKERGRRVFALCYTRRDGAKQTNSPKTIPC